MAAESGLQFPADAAWFAGKRVMVVGLARSGYAAIRLLHALHAQPIVVDSKTEGQLAKTLVEHGRPSCPCFFDVDPLPLLSDLDAVVISPAVPIDGSLVREAAAKSIPVIGELELGYLASGSPIVAVTGTNGKTTTVTLLGCMLSAAGRTHFVCGNIGYPLSEAVCEAGDGDELVVEVSSFQLETTHAFHPRVAVLLNITPDHLNRHYTLDAYIKLKYHVFDRQTQGDIAVLNADDSLCFSAQRYTRAAIHWFSMFHPVADGAFTGDGTIWLARNGQYEAVCEVSELLVPGRHNVMNALAATAAAGAVGVSATAIAQALRSFSGVEHRIEFVTEIDGIRYLNDSKGTNPESTMRAIEAMDRPTVILLGGQDKGTPFAELASCIKRTRLIRHAVLLGETAQHIGQCLAQEGYGEVSYANSLGDAVHIARDHASDRYTVLLSPACASFDMFDDYEHRGRVFKDLVRQMTEGQRP